MKFPWPPSEEENWVLQTHKVTKQKEKNFFLPLQKQDHLLLAVRIRTSEPNTRFDIEIPVGEAYAFRFQAKSQTWTTLPYPIEQHAIGSVWQSIEVPLDDYTIELAYFPWHSRHFRMRALVNTEGHMVFAYRINKKGQTVLYTPPKDHLMTLPEDTYIIPPTDQINTKSILLLPSQSHLLVKKTPESRYFNI